MQVALIIEGLLFRLRQKPLFGKQGKVLNLDHLYFDIVSDLELRISDFASLGISTLVEMPLQITPFYAKQTQFQKKSNDVNPYNTTDYERKRNWTLSENKPNSNPNKPNFKRAKMNINSITTKDYRKKDDFAVRINKPNSNPIAERVKIDAKCVFTKDYEE